MPRIYLDNAATSFPKPEAVYRAVDRYQRELGSAVGRGSSRAGLEVQRIVERCRNRAARLLGAAGAERVIFTANGTDSLNLALHGLLREGDRVLTTVWEHNSVWRPLADLRERLGLVVNVIPPGQGLVDLDAFRDALRTGCRLVVLTHASNVTGEILPVAELARMAHEAGALVLVDAAQTAGHEPVSLSDLGADLIATPGHKGLLGPLGTGLLILGEGIETQLRPMRQGGTGTSSESDRQPETLPERYESGNLNAPGIVGLEAALDWREQHSREGEFETRDLRLAFSRFIASLRGLPGLVVHRRTGAQPGVDLVSLSSPRVAPQVLAALLEEHFGIETRAGLHCAPRAHQELGTFDQGGTVRFSAGQFTTTDHLDTALAALAQITAAM